MALSDRCKKCICIKEYTAPTNDDMVTFTHKAGRSYFYLDYDYAPHVVGIYGKNNKLLVGISLEDFKNHFQEKK